MATGRLPDPNTAPVTAKGDLYTYSTVPAKLAVGNNGETLVADSSASVGLRYQPSQAAGKNYLINGAFDIWQRGTSGFTSAAYTADRWQAALNSGTFTVSRSTDVPTSPYFAYSLSMAATTAQNMQIFQNIESANATLFAGQTVTLSVWAKNSAGTSKLSYVGLYPTAVDNFTSSTTDVSGDLTATSWSGSWTKYSVTFTANALATRGYKIIIYRNGTESSTTLLTGIQLEFGSVATAFTRAGGTLAGELVAAMRYYEKSYEQSVSPTTTQASGYINSLIGSNTVTSGQRYNQVYFKVTKRTAPTVTVRPYTTPTNSARVSNSQGVDLGAGSGTVLNAAESSFGVYNNSGGSLTTTDQTIVFHYEASAEL